MNEKAVSFSASAPYYIQGELSPSTAHIWIVCHGYGQLARYFAKRMDVLDAEKNFIIAPQGLDRFYLNQFTKVAASWTTRENRDTHVENQLNYLDQIFQAELHDVDWSNTKLTLLGFSQGVSVVTRWAAYRNISFDRMILWAGGFPPELTAEHWTHLKSDAEVWTVVGDEDPYINEEKMKSQGEMLTSAFGKTPQLVQFKGGHEISREILAQYFN